MIKVLYVEPMSEPRIMEVESTVKSLQSLVGGYIQALYPWEDEVAVLCDDEGKFKHYLLNRAIETDKGEIYDVIAGNFLIVGLRSNNFASLSAEHIVKYRKKFSNPEVFIKTRDNHLIMLRGNEKARIIA